MDKSKYTLEQILNYKIIGFGNYYLTTEKLLVIILIVVLTKVLLVVIKRSILKYKKLENKDEGSLFTIIQIINYVGWIIAIILILDTIGIKITVLLTGSAALLVGVGLGLQQTFNDFVSGIILLIEGKTKVGDILQFDNEVVMLKEIGVRTSEGINRDDITIVIPNSKIVNDKVVNWSHQKKKTRFRIDVGVAYGSDVDLVVKIIEDSALEHPDIFRIEKVKSDIRKIINRNFIKNNITIPFPQMDVYVKQKI